jgi:RNA polymerase-interacting CarD/CdnL/TRCF family regulator
MLDTAKNLLVKELSLVNNIDADEIESQLLALLEATEPTEATVDPPAAIL